MKNTCFPGLYVLIQAEVVWTEGMFSSLSGVIIFVHYSHYFSVERGDA